MKSEINEDLLRALIGEANTFRTTQFSGFGYWKRGYDEVLTREDGPHFQLYAGIGVVIKDFCQYLDSSPRDDAHQFQKLVSPIISDNQKRFPKSSMFGTDFAGTLPEGFADAAAKGSPILTGLGHWTIVHEWTVKPGKAFFVKFAKNFKEIICGKDGPYEQFRDKKLVGQAQLPLTIASTILTAGFAPATFWYPLAVYIGLLLSKTVLKTYCETGELKYV